MTPEVLAQSLDPFFTTKDVGQGSGLGLPVAFGIVHGHQGYLRIDTKPGEGTCVGIYLPRLVAAEAGPLPGRFEGSQVLEPEVTPGRNILVIDDEEAVLDVVRRFLEIAGHTVTCATSAARAFEAMNKISNVDLVILDLMIPGEEGTKTFQTLRQAHPNLPVLLCTGLLQADHAAALLQNGAADLLRKPFRMNELWHAVNKTLGQRSGEVF